jgi:hypothetical protein
MDYRPEQLLAVVERSPQLVAIHDRQGWLDLFSDDAVVEDPIGSPPALKASGLLGRFWDTFIAPHQIEFEVKRDLFSGRDVFRDVIIHTRITDRVQIDVPAYLLYQLEERGGTLHVRRLAAHWELARLSLGALKLGPRAWLPMTRLFARMIGRMGLGWVGGYLASLWGGIGSRGLKTLNQLVDAMAGNDDAALKALFDGAPSSDLPRSRVTVESPVAAGWTVTFRFRIEGGPEGLGLLEFSRDSKKIARARFFTSAQQS